MYRYLHKDQSLRPAVLTKTRTWKKQKDIKGIAILRVIIFGNGKVCTYTTRSCGNLTEFYHQHFLFRRRFSLESSRREILHQLPGVVALPSSL